MGKVKYRPQLIKNNLLGIKPPKSPLQHSCCRFSIPLIAREIVKRCTQVKKQLWGGEFWTDGYYAGTVGKHGNENTIGDYVKKQGKKYQKLHEDRQSSLF